ncbi:MAG: DUF1294 domain-containing protein [Paludibacter sp.]|nr:DUF1294 domain-containing protein [Paludibacter sp.]
MHNFKYWYYIGIINLLSGFIFVFDKQASIKGHRRIPEQTLHLLEILGGVFANLLLMYTLRHKNRKFSYWVWTWLIGIGWFLFISRFYSNLQNN